MELPMKIVEATTKNPNFMILFSKPKAGKTTALAALENNLIIDIENGSDFVSGLKVKANTVKELSEVAKLLKEKKDEGFQYKYITLDTATALEDLVNDLAIKLYKETPMGKNYGTKPGENNIKMLPNGAGYLYIREAFEKVINMFKQFPSECLILLGHVNDKLINRDGEEISEMQLDLTGKLARIMYSRADAVGFLYRKGNKCFINFNGGGDMLVEARASHLRGKEILISEQLEDKSMKFNWDEIFI